MNAAELRAVAASLPADTVVPVTAGNLLRLIDGLGPPPAGPPRDLTVAEVAVRLHLSKKTVTRYLASGHLRGTRLPGRGWRVSQGALDTFRRPD
jgi:excisionase family DNA binding protein